MKHSVLKRLAILTVVSSIAGGAIGAAGAAAQSHFEARAVEQAAKSAAETAQMENADMLMHAWVQWSACDETSLVGEYFGERAQASSRFRDDVEECEDWKNRGEIHVVTQSPVALLRAVLRGGYGYYYPEFVGVGEATAGNREDQLAEDLCGLKHTHSETLEIVKRTNERMLALVEAALVE